jgi:aryl-alcohol dehydrogenase-like predicted oxidoreductase
MEYATLGNTGLLVSKLCFGTMTFGDGRGLFKAISSVGQAGADELVKTSIDGGINFFDTADNYTEGESEKILGESFKNLNIARQDVVIATKVYSRVGLGRNDIGASRGHIMDGVDASLRRLQTDHIDLYQIHGNDSVTPVEETIRALDILVQQGKVRYIGCSNWQAWKIAKALGISEFRNLTRFRLITRSPAAISNGKSSPCWNRKRSACSCGVRLLAACFPASSAGRTRRPRIRAAVNTTFPSWTKNGPGRS